MTFVIAHRGATRHAPENTLAAFAAARHDGADWVELDVRRTGDGVIAVHHDAHLADGRPIVELRSDDLPDDVPLLISALEACSGMGVNIEIKSLPDDPDYDTEHRLSESVAALVLSLDSLDAVLVSSFDVGALARIKAVDASIRTGWLTFDLTDPAQAVERVAANGHDAINPYFSYVDQRFMRRVREAGIEVFAWTVNEPERMAELVELGVDGLITDRPDLARAIVDDHTVKSSPPV